jgi:ABC-type antimicrobial peptide transport system permease subunit
LGATTTQITGLLSKEYIIIVLAANALSMPLAFYFVNQWLDNFPYHTNVDLSLGFLTLVLALIIAIVTVSFQAIKAAMINPVKSLKEE